VPAKVGDEVVEQRILEQASRIRSYGAVTAWASLRWQGAAFFDGTTPGGSRRLPVPIVLGPARLQRDPRVDLSQEQLSVSEIAWLAGIPLTTPERAVFDEVRRRNDLREGVVALEMAIAANLVTLAGFAAYVVTRQAWTGVPLTREVLDLTGGECLSPPEVRMRLVWILDCRLPAPICNRPVFDLRGTCSGSRTCSIPTRALSASTTALITRDMSAIVVMWRGRRSSATTGWSTSRSSAETSAMATRPRAEWRTREHVRSSCRRMPAPGPSTHLPGGATATQPAERCLRRGERQLSR